MRETESRRKRGIEQEGLWAQQDLLKAKKTKEKKGKGGKKRGRESLKKKKFSHISDSSFGGGVLEENHVTQTVKKRRGEGKKKNRVKQLLRIRAKRASLEEKMGRGKEGLRSAKPRKPKKKNQKEKGEKKKKTNRKKMNIGKVGEKKQVPN